MSEHRRESDGLLYRVLRFWPLVVFIGGTIIAYVRMGSTVERLDKEVVKIPAIQTDVAVLKSQMDYVVQTVGRIDRRMERRER